jgi:hypothetical protein
MGIINEDELDDIFCPPSDSEPSPVSRTSCIASRLFDAGSLIVESEEVEV